MKKWLLAAFCAVMAGAAYAGGQFTNQLPSAATSYGILGGSETVPVDTNLSAGAQPQTVSATITQFRSYSYVQATPLTGGTVTATSNTRVVQLTPAGTLSTLTIVWPPLPVDGQVFRIFSTQAVTTLTNTLGAGQSLNGTLSSLSANTAVEYVYNASGTTWYRIQ